MMNQAVELFEQETVQVAKIFGSRKGNLGHDSHVTEVLQSSKNLEDEPLALQLAVETASDMVVETRTCLVSLALCLRLEYHAALALLPSIAIIIGEQP
jgi:hypothetical protein